ncbi:hypothetical protein CAPTEDRAFT_152982 [Capitella teleta]|uniref:SOCS box domain-containing protein n=1 Tax=Capitella teleta TaxID=283909 RepID=R7U4G7_CAPTE|nr:hypothetical protein CAPTEDRAFT_152982 [Capitella teleta]|eukprot:ELU00854.1 hypothetical protein CAPTEDRAFT_152982 [Capitella teleta]
MLIASKHGYYDAMETLLDNGAVVNYNDQSEASKALAYLTIHPLNSAIENNHTDCVELLLKRGCDPNQKYFLGNEINLVPLEHIECLEMLLKYGADPNAVSRGGLTALMKAFAITEGRADVCLLLLDHGANPNEIDTEGVSLLQIACATSALPNQYTIIEMLLNHSANPNYFGAYPSLAGPTLTPLVEYFTNNDTIDFSLVKLLVKYGSGVNITQPTRLFKILDAQGLLPQIRKLRPYEEIFHFLINVAQKFDLRAIKVESSLSNGQKETLLVRASHPTSLKHQSRLLIRKTLCLPVLKSLRLLPLPKYLVNFLEFEAD